MSLNTRIKRTKEIREEYIEQHGVIFQLPDETLLRIFKYLKTDELILAAGVCKWFRRIVYDEEFWGTIDLTSKSYSNRVLMKFLHRFPRHCTEVFKISAISNDKKSIKHLFKPPPFTEQISTCMRTSYPNLRHLYISGYDFHPDSLSIKNISYFPANLQGLYLKQCKMLTTNNPDEDKFFQIPKNPLKNSTPNFTLKQLEIISFENCSCLASASFNHLITLCPNLVEINLNGCYRITKTVKNTLLSFNQTLRRLYLKETQIDDDTIHCICRNLKRLNILDLTLCKNVTLNIVENLLTLAQLQKLLANDDIKNLYEQKKLT